MIHLKYWQDNNMSTVFISFVNGFTEIFSIFFHQPNDVLFIGGIERKILNEGNTIFYTSDYVFRIEKKEKEQGKWIQDKNRKRRKWKISLEKIQFHHNTYLIYLISSSLHFPTNYIPIFRVPLSSASTFFRWILPDAPLALLKQKVTQKGDIVNMYISR